MDVEFVDDLKWYLTQNPVVSTHGWVQYGQTQHLV